MASPTIQSMIVTVVAPHMIITRPPAATGVKMGSNNASNAGEDSVIECTQYLVHADEAKEDMAETQSVL